MPTKRCGVVLSVLISVSSALCLAACSIHYTVGLEPLPPQPVTAAIPIPSRVSVPEATATYVYHVRSGMAGYANSWDINVGEAIVQYSQAFLGNAFAPGSEMTIQIDLDKFEEHDFEAHADVRFTIQRDGRIAFQKSYHGQGIGYAARVVWGGAFAMKSAMRKTTDESLRSVFTQFLQDAQAHYREWG